MSSPSKQKSPQDNDLNVGFATTGSAVSSSSSFASDIGNEIKQSNLEDKLETASSSSATSYSGQVLRNQSSTKLDRWRKNVRYVGSERV